jgi:L-ribulokinase
MMARKTASSGPAVVGLDFGTDSVRALVVDARSGAELGESVSPYARWGKGRYCDPSRNQFRQHPQDHMDSLQAAVRGALANSPPGTASRVQGLAVASTGSTPVAVDAAGRPLALSKEFRENPDAMFVLWKDHTAVAEAAEINQLAKQWPDVDYTRFSGGVYSSEWFWSKILHIHRANARVARAACSWMEHCDWIPALLTGATELASLRRSRCAAGHKAMWNATHGGLPGAKFLARLHPSLPGLRTRLYTETYTSDLPAGRLCPEWASRLGLPQGIAVAVGGFDAHIGAVGGGITPGILVKVMGTSTCDMLVPTASFKMNRVVKGICGQVDGSILPGFPGLEAGQSAMGDLFAWYRNLLLWPVRQLAEDQALAHRLHQQLLPALDQAARASRGEDALPLALDWLNGRRTPFANQALEGAYTGINLGTTALDLYRAMAEGAAFGARSIIDCFTTQGAAIQAVHAVGGIAVHAPYIMQVHADALNRPIRVVRTRQACAMGAAMFAATAAGLYPDVLRAQKAMFGGLEKTFFPRAASVRRLDAKYRQYKALAAFVEKNRP